MEVVRAKEEEAVAVIIKLDLGCGKLKKEGFVGIDRIAFDGVDHVFHMGRDRWPFDNASVDEAQSIHSLEHLTALERVHFCNELYRVLKPDAKCLIVTPYWASGRAYGDYTHQYPPVCEFWLQYLLRDWRKVNAPHNDIENVPEGYNCNFEATYGYALHPMTAARSTEAQQFQVMFYKEAAQDMITTLIKK